MSFLNVIPGLLNGLINENNLNGRQLRIQQENERSNLLVIAKLVLNAFLDFSVRGTRNIDVDTQELVDLLVIIEKTLWHGFRPASKSRLSVRRPDDELWSCLGVVAKGNTAMNETYRCVDCLDNLETSITRVRAFLRMGIMKKELADYFQLLSSADLSSFYEEWAFLRCENGSSLAGSLLALRVFDCNLLLDYNILSELPHNIDLAGYVKVPVVPSQFAHYSAEEADIERERMFQQVLDQKHYIEERNRQLTNTLSNVTRKLSQSEKQESPSDLMRKLEDLQVRLLEEKKQRELVCEKYAAKRDECRLLISHIRESTKLFDKKLSRLHKSVIDLGRKVERDVKNTEMTFEESLTYNETMINRLKEKMDVVKGSMDGRSMRTESDYFNLLTKLEEKQNECNSVRAETERLEEVIAKYQNQQRVTQEAIQELADLKVTHSETLLKVQEMEQTLEDLGPQLSLSKMQVVLMKEQLMPVSEWMKDSDVSQCQACSVDFSVTVRKHHCRRCGQIFCDSCSQQRVNLPSHAKQVRVCQPCLRLLETLHQSAISS